MPHSGAPAVSDPLPESAIPEDPCDAFTREQIEYALGDNAPEGKREELPTGPTCTWQDSESGAGFGAFYSTTLRQGLSAYYKNSKPQVEVWRELPPIGGFPAIAYQSDKEEVSCGVAIGFADDYVIEVPANPSRAKIGELIRVRWLRTWPSCWWRTLRKGRSVMGDVSEAYEFWDNHVVARLVRQVKAGSATEWESGVQVARQLAESHAEISDRGRRALTVLESAWTGGGAEAAQAKIKPAIEATHEAANTYEGNARTLADGASTFDQLKSALIPMPDAPPTRNFYDKITPWDTDTEDAINEFKHLEEQNRRIYESYEQSTRSMSQQIRIDYGQLDDEFDTDLAIAEDDSAGKGKGTGTITFHESGGAQGTTGPGSSPAAWGSGAAASPHRLPCPPPRAPGAAP